MVSVSQRSIYVLVSLAEVGCLLSSSLFCCVASSFSFSLLALTVSVYAGAQSVLNSGCSARSPKV